jgi:hypothetical protein
MNKRLISGTDSLFLAQAEGSEQSAEAAPRSPAHQAYRSRTVLAQEIARPAPELPMTPERRVLIDDLMQARQAVLEKVDPILRETLRAVVEEVMDRPSPPTAGSPGEPKPNAADTDGRAGAPARDGRHPGD